MTASPDPAPSIVGARSPVGWGGAQGKGTGGPSQMGGVPGISFFPPHCFFNFSGGTSIYSRFPPRSRHPGPLRPSRVQPDVWSRSPSAVRTILGEVEVREAAPGENSIFRDRLKVHSRQGGIIRYCYVYVHEDPHKDSQTAAWRAFRCVTVIRCKSSLIETPLTAMPTTASSKTSVTQLREGAAAWREMGVYITCLSRCAARFWNSGS